MSMPRMATCKCGCGASLEGNKPWAVYATGLCRGKAKRQRNKAHPKPECTAVPGRMSAVPRHIGHETLRPPIHRCDTCGDLPWRRAPVCKECNRTYSEDPVLERKLA